MDWIDAINAPPRAKSDLVDAETQRITFTDWTRADRCKRQIIEAIHACDTPEEIADYVMRETLTIDALYLFDPDMEAAIREAAQDHRAALMHGADPYCNTSNPRPGGFPVSHTKGHTMARNNDFKKVVVKDVELLWPRLDRTYRYNAADKATEACDPSAQGAGWSVGFKLPLDRAGELKKELLAHYAEAAAGNKKLPKEGTIFGAKRMKDADGNALDFVQFTAKKRAVSNAGTPNKAPQVVGPDLQPLEGDDAAIWTGSVGHIRALAFPTVDPEGKGGISLLLDAVQVIEPVYGGDSLEDDFGPAVQRSIDDLPSDEPGQEKPKAPPAPAEAADLDF